MTRHRPVKHVHGIHRPHQARAPAANGKAAEVPTPAGATGPADSSAVASHRRKVVLVLEDYASVGGLVAALIRQAGYRAVRAWDAEEALRLARGRRPDLVLLDLNAPNAAAVEAFRTLLESEATRACPVLVVTAQGLALSPEEEALAVEVVAKPFDIDLMLNAVRRGLGDPVEDIAPRQYDPHDHFLNGY